MFAGSLFLFQFVQKQFFPNATRLELIVDLKLPEGSSLAATQTEVTRLETYLNNFQQAHIANFVARMWVMVRRAFIYRWISNYPTPVLRNW